MHSVEPQPATRMCFPTAVTEVWKPDSFPSSFILLAKTMWKSVLRHLLYDTDTVD
jgi:hypothetical protein